MMEKQSKRKARPWLFGGLFVWALIGAVAVTAMSSRPAPVSKQAGAADHDHEAAGHTAADHDPITGQLKLPVQSSPLAAAEKTVANKVAVPEVAAARTAKVGQITWENSFEEAMQRARIEKKPLMIDFYTDWCSWCKELDAKVYPDKTVVKEAQNWVSIRIDAEKRPDVASAYGVTGYPTIIFAANSGIPIDTVTGFAPAPEFLQEMQSARAKWSPQG
jgi:thiol-disulfide isomerase/thioredoxin